ncbi:hypothetical protein K435DRAFT_786784 [Dendrothele bispora CBS 962.96]|uniref:F-box domain-containing protein n=1 Tax=Dendrothele bispora (strain CBS 962.96) TaxID=1314807 RepID=A0A4S8KNR0_DENBC|nr:hypothetical protein K435DRAFT_786784 [Dendrothele bispora CBS 962.96]
MATSLEDLPDELLHRIIESFDFHQYPTEIQMHYKPFRHCDSYSSHPVDSVSLVNRRLRRLSLPILFRKVTVRYLGDVEQFRCLMEVFKQNTHLTPLIRLGCITSEEPVTLVLINVLSRCTGLEHLDLPGLKLEFGRSYLRPILEALNSHPSDNIHLQFVSIVSYDPESLSNLRSISLTRVICQYWEQCNCSDQDMKTLLAQGLSIQSIRRNGYIDASWTVDDSWMDMTYPGLTEINGWIGNERSLQSTIDFLLRHPLLEKIEFNRAHECDMTPWHVAFVSKMYPYSVKIGKRDFPARPWGEGNSVVKIGEEWLYREVKVVFQDDISHGDVETVETMVRTLRKALPQPSPTYPRVGIDFPRVGIDFSSPVGEYLTSDDLIGILTRNMSDIRYLDLGKFLSDILTRECSRIHEPGSTVQEHPIPGLASFSERLRQAWPRNKSIRGRTQNPQGEWICF